jgi:hypothetical protein
MSIMLNESNSSFDTTPSFDFVMRHDDGRDDEVVVPDAPEEEEGYDLMDDGGNEHREDNIGVLILPPTTTGSSEDSRNTVLSIPDSVPTVLNSTLLDLPDCVHVVDHIEPTPVRSHSTKIQGNDAEEDWNGENAQNDSVTETASSPNAWRRHVLTLLFLAAVSTGSVCHALYLHRESQLLKEQVRILTDQAARSAATLEELQRKQVQENIVMMDNCWLQAHAQMSLGECTQEATEAMKETAHSFGTSVHNFWENIKEGYQENVRANASLFGGWYTSSPANATIANLLFGNQFEVLLNPFKKIKATTFTETVTEMSSSLHDLWKNTKSTFNVAVNCSKPLKTCGSDKSRFWRGLQGFYKQEVGDQFNDVGRSLYDAPSTIFHQLRRGFSDLKHSFNESMMLHMKLGIAEWNTTTLADNNDTETNLSDHLPNNVNAVQSISKKVLIAAAWSAGAAILVSTFDMYWNQHGSFPALEN